jgi:type IV secretory pathway VirB10-like protein
MRQLKSLQRQWRQAMNAPVVFAGMVNNAYNTGGTATPSMANSSSLRAGNGLIAADGVIPPGIQRPYVNSGDGIGSGDQGTTIQQEHRAFMKSSAAIHSYLTQSLTPPVSPYEIQAGTVIPGALVTGINSDLPGQIIGTVTQNVFDSVSGKYLLIPQGSRLLGRYSSVVGNGENRVLVAWQRLILPNGDSIVLNAMPGTNQEGQSGLHDRVNYHFAKLAQAAALSTAIAYGGNLAINPNSTSTNQDVVGNTIAHEGSQIGQKIIDRQLNVQPTITIRPGWPFRVLVNEDMILKPYRP